ncbi:tRNA (guanine(10)-N(2))-dimethyltransferase [Halobacteriales archaeon QS_1_68_20]|nr:MAG: tRNA (guanine(10)-N(2))-dimethyltransferase [Halobacteriales archaeon QS_1_68_20]
MHVQEGGAELDVPEQPDAGAGEGVFFNPDQELNRDVTVAVLRAYREREERAETYLDAMAASGARGVRAAAEGWDVTLCDTDPDAVDLARENLARNGLDGEVVERDVNALLHDSYFDVVDLDPFGSPMPFADAAFANARDLVCVTATDTAPLCGAHFEAGVRRYSAVPRNTEYHAEMGVRVLVSALARTAARYDVGAVPVLSHVTDHYARTYLELQHRATDADVLIEELGHVYHCQQCLHRETGQGLIADPPEGCPACGESQVVTAGPVWLGSLHDPDFVEAVREAVDDEMGTADRARDLLATVGDELDLPFHYDQHRLYKRWGKSAVGMDEFLGRLRDAGFSASRTHYGGTTLKTDATVTEMADLFAEESG